jgi:hypothetical protein
MLNFLKRRLKNQKGAMDKILVTLLLVIVGVGAVIGLAQWATDQKNDVQNGATNAITNVMTNSANGN